MRATRRSGFTLIETVAAIVILAVAVPPMLWAVTESQRQRINPMMASRAAFWHMPAGLLVEWLCRLPMALMMSAGPAT